MYKPFVLCQVDTPQIVSEVALGRERAIPGLEAHAEPRLVVGRELPHWGADLPGLRRGPAEGQGDRGMAHKSSSGSTNCVLVLKKRVDRSVGDVKQNLIFPVGNVCWFG